MTAARHTMAARRAMTGRRAMVGGRALTVSWAAGAFALAAIAGCAAQEPQIETSDATVRVPLTPDVTSAYMTIENTGGADDTLIGADTAVADEVQMHESVHKDDGTTGMEERDEIPVKAGETVSFEPGKLHLMLMDPDSLEAGGTVALELRFEKSGTVEVEAEVEDVMGDNAENGGDMGSMDEMDHGDMDDMDHGDMDH